MTSAAILPITVSPATVRESTPTTICAAAREIDVDARAETNEADALAGGQQRAFVSEAHDPSRDEAGDLDDAEPPRGGIDGDAVALVVLARLVQVGVEEQTRMIDDLRDAALHRGAIDVAVEDRHENRHPLHRRHAEAELRRRRGEAGGTDDAVGGRDDEVAADRGDAGRIAEEIRAPQRGDEAEPSKRRPQPPQDERRDGEAEDEEIAFRMDRRELTAQRFYDAH